MQIITVNIGQGDLAIIRHNSEAIIVDSRIPPSDDDTVAYAKGMLATYLKDYYVKGLILTGFDQDHSDATGVAIILKKYRPDWIMYPKYYKDSEEAKAVFKVINEEERLRANTNNPLTRYSVRVDNVNSRILAGLSSNYELELFSPHPDDMDTSNNSSIVLRVRGKGLGGFSYLITGDTENDRWENINRIFGDALRSDVLAAPHHGSRHSTNAETILHIQPNTVLISAGVDNPYGHPHSEVVRAYGEVAKHVYSTNVKGGVSLITSKGVDDFITKLIPVKNKITANY